MSITKETLEKIKKLGLENKTIVTQKPIWEGNPLVDLESMPIGKLHEDSYFRSGMEGFYRQLMCEWKNEEPEYLIEGDTKFHKVLREFLLNFKDHKILDYAPISGSVYKVSIPKENTSKRYDERPKLVFFDVGTTRRKSKTLSMGYSYGNGKSYTPFLGSNQNPCGEIALEFSALDFINREIKNEASTIIGVDYEIKTITVLKLLCSRKLMFPSFSVLNQEAKVNTVIECPSNAEVFIGNII